MNLSTPYQITKMLGELYCNFFYNHYDVPVVKTRFFNSYGPGEVPGQYRNVIPNFIYWAMQGGILPITGTGEETRDFTYVDDITDGLLRAGYFEAAIGQEMNLASGREIKILDLAKMESGRMEVRLAPFDLATVVGAQCDMARPLAEKKNIDLDLQTSNGRIEVEGVKVTSLASLETSNGRVTLIAVAGDVKVKTSNGKIDIQGFIGQLDARTSNGSIDFTGTLRSDSENELRTSNGSIEVTLVDTPGVELDAATSNGNVRSELPITISGGTRDDRLAGTIGAGGSRLGIHTSNGSITIR